MYRLLLIFALYICFQTIYAQAPKYSNEFLSLGVGARQLAMGNASVATTDNVYSTYWNPAGLMGVDKKIQLGGMHSEIFSGFAKHDYLGICTRTSDSTVLGFSMIRYGVDDIPNTLELFDNQGNLDYNRITTFSAIDYAFMGSVARKSNLLDGLVLGANAKIIRRIIGDFGSSWGFGVDLSAQYQKDKLRLGIMARDITTTFNAWTYNTEEFADVFAATGNEIPENSTEITLPKFILGVAYEFPVYKSFTGIAEVDFDITTDGKRNTLIKSDPLSIDPHVGLELIYKETIFARTGLMNMQMVPDENETDTFDFQPNMGVGVIINKLTIDYAFTDIGDNSIAFYSHVFSLTYSLD